MGLHNSLVEPSDSASSYPDWRRRLPELSDGVVTLREVRARDASSLVAHLNQTRLWHYVAPCPSTTADFCRFIRWTHAARRRGELACYGIVPAKETCAVGIIQIWPIERDFSTAEWGFVLGESFWGSGLFMRSGRLVLDMAFSHLGVYRLEARAVDINVRGNGVLAKLGAKREGVLRRGFRDGSVVHDHVMWSILAPEWEALGREARRAN